MVYEMGTYNERVSSISKYILWSLNLYSASDIHHFYDDHLREIFSATSIRQPVFLNLLKENLEKKALTEDNTAQEKLRVIIKNLESQFKN